MPSSDYKQTSELRPCPFCRRKAHVRRCTDEYGDPTDGYRCFCSGCTDGPWGETREEAIKRWNTRPIDDALRAELARKDALVVAQKDLIDSLTAQVAGFAGLLISIDPTVAGNEFLAILTQNVQAARARLVEVREGGKS